MHWFSLWIFFMHFCFLSSCILASYLYECVYVRVKCARALHCKSFLIFTNACERDATTQWCACAYHLSFLLLLQTAHLPLSFHLQESNTKKIIEKKKKKKLKMKRREENLNTFMHMAHMNWLTLKTNVFMFFFPFFFCLFLVHRIRSFARLLFFRRPNSVFSSIFKQYRFLSPKKWSKFCGFDYDFQYRRSKRGNKLTKRFFFWKKIRHNFDKMLIITRRWLNETIRLFQLETRKKNEENLLAAPYGFGVFCVSSSSSKSFVILCNSCLRCNRSFSIVFDWCSLISSNLIFALTFWQSNNRFLIQPMLCRIQFALVHSSLIVSRVSQGIFYSSFVRFSGRRLLSWIDKHLFNAVCRRAIASVFCKNHRQKLRDFFCLSHLDRSERLSIFAQEWHLDFCSRSWIDAHAMKRKENSVRKDVKLYSGSMNRSQIIRVVIKITSTIATISAKRMKKKDENACNARISSTVCHAVITSNTTQSD